MRKKGVESFIITFVGIAIACMIFLVLAFVADFMLGIEVKNTVMAEQKFIHPFLMTQSLSFIFEDGMPFFQKISYLSAGEKMDADFSDSINNRLSSMSSHYIVSLFARRLTGYNVGSISGTSSEDIAASAMTPVFTFEKKQDILTIVTTK